MSYITFGAWNVRTLLDRKKSNRPERRTALVAKELARYNIDIAALSETRLADEGQCTETAGYTFYWIGKGANEKREYGVGFAIKSNLVQKLDGPPKGINERMMTVRLPLTKKRFVTIISVYAPTMTNPDESKERFYSVLESTIQAVPKTDKLIVLGDFNARVGTDWKTWEGVLGRHSTGKCNSNGKLLLQTCTANSLLITNSIFQLPHRKKVSWKHPRSKQWHLLDYVIVRQRDRQDVRVTKAMCGADCWTDHQLLISKMSIRTQPLRRPQGKKALKKLDVGKLAEPNLKRSLATNMKNKLAELPSHNTFEEEWPALRDAAYSVTKDVVGVVTHKHQDWFDDNDPRIQELLDIKHKLHKTHLSDKESLSKKAAYDNAKQTVQKELRKMEDQWFSGKSDEIEMYADTCNMKDFYRTLNAVYGPQQTRSSPPLLNADGSELITEKDKILSRWAEHFDNVLNRPSTVNDEAIDRLAQVPINASLERPPDVEEVTKAIASLSNGKAPGSDAIPAEVYSSGGPELTARLTDTFKMMWTDEKIPQEYKDASIIHLYKKKGNRQVCDNHRGISLLSIAGKILARVLLNRLQDHLETKTLLPESQCGFRRGRGTVDMIFAARQLQEKCREQNVGLYTTFVDLTKAFDTVSRNGLWKIMGKFGCPNKFINMVRQFHDGMEARVQENGECSNPFPVTNGVKQGCVLAPTLFSMLFTAMRSDAFRHEKIGINLRSRMDGGFYKLQRLQAPTKVMVSTIQDLLFADDCALSAATHDAMQQSMNLFSTACTDFGLTISIKKTEVLYQPPPGKPHHEPTITVNGEKLEATDKFAYLGSTLSTTGTIDDEVNLRIARASASFGRLRERVWNRRGISQSTKLKVYRAVVLPSLLYGSETWTVYARHSKQLNSFHLRCLRQLLHVKWQEHVPDTDILSRAKMDSIHAKLMKSQLRWAGHVARMPDDRLPKQIFFGELCEGARSRGRPLLRYKDTLKVSLKNCKIDPDTWESFAQNRPSWRHQSRSGTIAFEQERINNAVTKRVKRKDRQANPTTDTTADQTFICPICNRSCRAQIGLNSHMRHRHKNNK